MPRPEKVQAVEDIKQRLDAAPAVFLTEYRGLSVPQQEKLREGLREAGADYKVVKMTLAAIAARDLGMDELADEMVGPTAIAFAGTDAVAGFLWTLSLNAPSRSLDESGASLQS